MITSRRYSTLTKLAVLIILTAVDSGRAEDKAKEQIQLKYSPWTKTCMSDGEPSGAQFCMTAKEGRLESGLSAVAVVVREAKDKTRQLRVQIPLSMQLVHGTRVIIDSNTPMQAPYVSCSKDGCFADYELSNDQLSKMRVGQNLMVQSIYSNGAPFTLLLPLADFAAGFDGKSKSLAEVEKTRTGAEDGKMPPNALADPLIGTRSPTINPTTEQARSLIYAPWTRFCLNGQNKNAKQVCFTGADGRLEAGINAGSPVVAAVLIEPDGEPKKTLRITLPLDRQLTLGTRITVGNQAVRQSPFVICFANGCVSDYEVAPELLKGLKSGFALKVQSFASDGSLTDLELPLRGFAKAYDGLPTDPKVLEETQKKIIEELKKRGDEAKAKVPPAPVVSPPIAPTVDAVPAAPPLSAATNAAQFGRRVALIMGNSAYKNMPRLMNPTNDATDVETALKRLGFETIIATDLDLVGMNGAISRFSRLVRGSDIALVYYAGHGMQFAGKNYLLPIDTNLESADDINRSQLLPVDDVIDIMSASKGLQLLVLDACRNNPIERDFKNKVASVSGGNRDIALTRGFSRINARSGLLVTYATAADDVASDGNGRNSPFTRALLQNIATPDVEVRTMLNQVQRDVYLATDSKQMPEISSRYIGPDIRLSVSANKQ